MSLTFIFALLKLQQMLMFKNPTISTFDQEMEITSDNAFSLNGDDFMLAFAIDEYGGAVKNDERYVKWFARYITKKKGEDTKYDFFPVRNCTSEDYDKFFEPAKSSAQRIENLKEARAFYCIDYDSVDMNLYSSWIYENDYTALDVVAAPCGYSNDIFKEPVREDCVWDPQDILDYLGNINLVLLYNEGVFK